MVTDYDLYEESIDIEIDESMLTTITLLEFQRFLAATFRLDVLEQYFDGEYFNRSKEISMEEYWQLDKKFHLADLQDYLNSKKISPTKF